MELLRNLDSSSDFFLVLFWLFDLDIFCFLSLTRQLWCMLYLLRSPNLFLDFLILLAQLIYLIDRKNLQAVVRHLQMHCKAGMTLYQLSQLQQELHLNLRPLLRFLSEGPEWRRCLQVLQNYDRSHRHLRDQMI